MNIDLKGKYSDLNMEAICSAYDRYINLYEGEWVQMGNYPEDGCSVPTENGREKALEILKGLYRLLRPYEQSIKADWEHIRENSNSLWWNEQAQIQTMFDICKEYHDKVEFIEMITEPQHSNESKSRKELPEELSTDVANKIFGTAISKGWIEVQNKQYKWVGFGKRPSIAQLAYLCGRVYGYVYKNSRNEGEHIPYNALEKLFNVERLDRSLAQVYEAVKPQSWRKEIDSLFD